MSDDVLGFKHVEAKGFNSDQPVTLRDINQLVQIRPAESVKRRGSGCMNLFTESIYAPPSITVEFSFQASVHLLAMYNEGGRRNGETMIRGLEPSRIRGFVNKLTFVPAGHAYREWHETAAATRVTFLYLNPVMLSAPCEGENVHAPRMHFEDSVVWETADKLARTLEGGKIKTDLYLAALSSVLAHELAFSAEARMYDRLSFRGGLASWQKRIVAEYIEEHLGDKISLHTLASLARLSQPHFCRAFKRSFRIPPHQYHVQRRIERAKSLLADRAASVTEIGLALGYSQITSFSVAFRKATGWTPSEYRREFEK
ncbi:AraC family transcriptional regulator [Bradyrhizobium sp. Tv2a-2]|uniref:AraC family transcriptional regulator n=1 Tax=Bradyrhizobium sp. Tv2a-2 TaxID=113395 RepID=UPI001FDA57C0|nr:AraC family transcriptional regulator [Bradyrhizobium sp. Tv2a-2]